MKRTIVVDSAVSIPLTITKVDKEKREVEGVASQEVVDAHGEIVDHESLKAVLSAWPGNIREMHQPKAVGKALQVVSDDDNKRTIVRAYVSKGAEDTWQKVLDGTLSMYSIGGTGKIVTTKNADGQDEKRILMSGLSEISLVDNGACPTAKFDIVKTVDGVPTEQMPADEAPKPAEKPAPVDPAAREACLKTLRPFVTNEKAIRAGAAAARAITKISGVPVRKDGYPEAYDLSCALQAVAMLEQLLAGEWWEAREELLDPDQDPDAQQTDQAQLGLLRSAIELVIAFIVSEFDEQFSDFDVADAQGDDDEDDDADPAAAAAAVAQVHRMSGADAIAKFVKGADLVALVTAVAKAGARHSKKDQDMVQKLHDTSVDLGAACGMDKFTVADLEKALEKAKTSGKKADDGGDSDGYQPEPYHHDPNDTVTCPKCDKGNDDDAKYCDQCGFELEGAEGVKVEGSDSATEKAQWTTAYMNDLPDSSFLYIEPGGTKDDQGKTTPRSKRHFPVKDKQGNVDKPHVKDALGRIPQSTLPADVKEKCLTKAQDLAKKNGIEVSTDKLELVAGQQVPDTETIVKAAVEQALAAQQATTTKAIAELTERIEKLTNTPRPGGPVARAVAVKKTLAGADAERETASTETDEVLRAFDLIASQAKTQDEKLAIAKKKVAYMHETGAGAVHPVTGHPLPR